MVSGRFAMSLISSRPIPQFGPLTKQEVSGGDVKTLRWSRAMHYWIEDDGLKVTLLYIYTSWHLDISQQTEFAIPVTQIKHCKWKLINPIQSIVPQLQASSVKFHVHTHGRSCFRADTCSRQNCRKFGKLWLAPLDLLISNYIQYVPCLARNRSFRFFIYDVSSHATVFPSLYASPLLI